MGKCKDLSQFDKGHIVMARRLDQSISKNAALVGCSRSAVEDMMIISPWQQARCTLSPLSAPVTIMSLKSLHLLLYETAGSSPNTYSYPVIHRYIFDLSKVNVDWTRAVWFWLLSPIQTRYYNPSGLI
ncbi:hypothetical protein QTP70_021568 [Hemibagrus guttatus]|uniref:Uncharacterized protein n=1 Tax=Hemibagrus guttatus TaxID=175788 RepID=A0AAE0Q6X5_9TELE|nr:hypothetical protein QTP70_021568 [Hemibagrus guttatus]